MLVALMLTMLGVSDAMAQKIYRAELDKSMFKAWNGTGADAQEVEPTSYVGKGGATVDFACETNFFKSLDQGAVVFGNTNVYSRWYADLTGTKKIYFKGDKGTAIRVLMNRPDAEEGAEDPNGGTSVEQRVEIGADGTGELDVTSMDYVHLNCIKIAWGSSGVIKSIELEGTVKPVTGILSMINNGDAEGDDLESFPVSYDGPNNGGTANERPEIVDGGVSGKCFKVTTFDAPTETWHTQFYIKSDEVLPKGTKWKLNMSIKADRGCTVTTSAQAQPRTWKGGMGIDEFSVSENWQNYSWSGEIGVDDFQSIAFDLNNEGGSAGNASNTFYFDNIEFGVDLGGSNPMNDITVSHGYDVVCVDFNGMTNLKDLVKAAPGGGKTLFYDNSVATVTIDGQPSELVSVEARPDGNLYFFLLEDNVESEDVEVKVGFKNPTDEAHKILFTTGKFEGQEVPEFSGVASTFDEKYGEGEITSSMWLAPMLESVEPEEGSFNLPADFKTFTVTFNQDIVASSVVAKLGSEALTVAPTEGEAKTFTLTRTADTAINGAVDLIISSAEGSHRNNIDPKDPIIVKYSYGPVSEDAQPAVIYASNFTGEGDNANGAGWKTTADRASGDDEQTLQEASAGGGSRLQHGQAGFAADVIYLAQRSAVAGIALYGLDEAHKLTLNGGVTYHLTLKSAQWDAYPASGSNRSLRAQILTEDAVDAKTGAIIDNEGILAEDFQAVNGRVKENKEFTAFDIAFTPETTGNFVIRLVAGNTEGNPAGYNDGNAIGDVKVEYIPDVLGVVENKTLNDALASAKTVYEELASNEDSRYAGEDLTALENLISEVETNKVNYTAPSVYNAKAAELEAKAKAANDHKSACDSYDENIKKAIDMVLDHEKDKFNQLDTYKDLKEITAKYHAQGVKENLAGEDEDPVWEVNYQFDLLTDNAQLAAANTELTAAVGLGEYIFTTVALDADIQQGNCGIAVLVERNRLGARTLKALGVAADDPIFEKVENAISDSETLAAEIKGRIKTILYTEMAKQDCTLFDPDEENPEFDDEGGMIGKSYDMSVFIKNPNIYCVDGTQGLSEENIPGWTFPIAGAGLFKKWDPQRNVAGLPEDCAFTIYFGNPCRMEQTITDLPAGVYAISLCGSDWSNQAGQDDETKRHDVNGFVYCKTSDTPAVEEGAEEDRELNFADTRTIVYGGQWNMDHATNLGYEEVIDEETGFVAKTDGEFFGIPVTDGKLTIGIHFAGDAQYFFQHARLTLKGAATGFDYAKAAQDIATGVDTAVAPTVRALQVYDLNGRRMIKANKGLQIVKKQMSDGSVRVEKVVVK